MRRLAILAVLACVACDDKASKRPFGPAATDVVPPPASSGIAATLGAIGADAGPLDLVDPPAPAGDLAKELEGFVNIETCVAQRASIDPLLADALRAIGYDTFVRDACRLLEAAKDKKRETCDRIDASSLRSRCKAWVAMLAQTPDGCPLLYEGLPARGRGVTCVAIAGRDPRLCVGEPRPSQRATCDALAARSEQKCEALTALDRAACIRELSRWRALLPSPLDGLPRLPEAKGKLVIKGEAGTADPKVTELDLAPDVGRGAVVTVGLRERLRVELGVLGESESARIAGAVNKRTRVGLVVTLDTPRGGGKEATPTLDRFELEVPGELPVVSPPGKCECRVTRARLDKARGGEVSVAVEGTLTGAGKTYKVSLAVTTFTRDVVTEDNAALTLPTRRP